MDAYEGRSSRTRSCRRPAVVGSRRSTAVRRCRRVVERRCRRRPVRILRIQRHARRPRRPSDRRAVDRRGPSPWQERRRILCTVRRRPFTRPAELGRVRRLHADHRARTRPRVPQHDVGGPHRSPATAPDGARRDREHLLRDLGRRGRAVAHVRSRAARPTRRRSRRHEPGHRRHPFPFPVRDRGVRPPPAAHAERSRAVRADDRCAGPRLRRRARPTHGAPVHVVAQAALLRFALLQLALHLRTAVRPRAVRPLSGRSRSVPLRLRRPALTCRHGHRRGAGDRVRARCHR